MRTPVISLRRQLILGNVLTLAVLMAALGLTARYAAVTAILASVDRNLEDRTHHPPFGHHPHFGERPSFDGRPPLGEHTHGPGGDFDGPPQDGRPPPGGPLGSDGRTLADEPLGSGPPRDFDSQGRPRRRPGGYAWDPAALAPALRGRTVFSTVTVGDTRLRVLTRPSWGGGAIQVAYALTDVDRAVAGLDRALLLLIPLALLGAGVVGAGLTTRVLRPVRQITQAAAGMGATGAARLPVQGADEFARMSATFNDLLARLDASFQQQASLLEQQRRFVADASHELKTPLTVIQGTASQMSQGPIAEEDAREAMTVIAGAAEGMTRLVQDLLLLARSDEGQPDVEHIAVLAREVLAQAVSHTPGGPPVSLQVEDETLTLCGSEDALCRLFRNLLQNAVRATPPDGRVTVTTRRQGPDAVITVADTGIGIAPEHLTHLGERFYRVDSARARRDGGTGLGLSICRSIVDAHGGALAFASTPGQGTTVTVTLPAG